MFLLRRTAPSPTVPSRGALALSLALAVLAGSPRGAATPLAEPESDCTGQEHERLRDLLRTFATVRPPQGGSIGYWTRAETALTYFGRYASNVTLEVAVFTTRTPAPGDGVEGRFGNDAREPLPRRGRSAFFDEIAVPPSLELHRLDTATLRLPRAGEVSVRVHTRGCYSVLLLHP